MFLFFFFFFNDTATTETYTLSLHDALPICRTSRRRRSTRCALQPRSSSTPGRPSSADRKSTRLNSSHVAISYAVFCLKKKKKTNQKINKKKKKKKHTTNQNNKTSK